MAFRKSLAQRLFNFTVVSPSVSSRGGGGGLKQSQRFESLIPRNHAQTSFNREFLTTSEDGFFRRFLQKRAIVQSAMSSKVVIPSSITIGDRLIEKLKEMNLNKDRLQLDGLKSPPPPTSPTSTLPPPPTSDHVVLLREISIQDTKKLLKLAHLEMLKSTLRRIPKNSISYSEFVQICIDGSNSDQGLGFAKMLDESGAVIVLGNVVFLRPEQVTKAIEGVIPLSIATQPNDPRRNEFEEMEKEKAAIDERAEVQVRRELWGGLGFLVVQTVGFMRLTFWELSWDVMEPICFFLTSMYFMAGYTFFLRTSKEPSFEGFFESRFHAKQKKLMKMKKFDIERFNELKGVFKPSSTIVSSVMATTTSPTFDHSERNLIGAMHH